MRSAKCAWARTCRFILAHGIVQNIWQQHTAKVQSLYYFDIFYRACISCTLRGYSQRSLRATCHSWAGLSPVRVYECLRSFRQGRRCEPAMQGRKSDSARSLLHISVQCAALEPLVAVRDGLCPKSFNSTTELTRKPKLNNASRINSQQKLTDRVAQASWFCWGWIFCY